MKIVVVTSCDWYEEPDIPRIAFSGEDRNKKALDWVANQKDKNIQFYLTEIDLI